MVQIWSPTVAFALLVVIQSVSSHLEGNNGEFNFTIPDDTRKFNDALSWCKAYNNSTLAVVNDSYTQTALTRFLESSNLTPTVYIDIRLSQEQERTWFLVNGSQYDGYIGNQDPQGSAELNYLLYCRLKHDGNHFNVEASSPSDFRYYICDYKENRCSSDSADYIVYNGRCYVKYENESLTWYQARERCINNGGDLSRFQTLYVNQQTPPFNTSWLNTSLTYWVGIRWRDLSWKSPESGQETIFTSWSKEEPNNYDNECVCVDQSKSPAWSWTDCDCSKQRQFVCLKKVAVQTTTLITTTMNPTTTVGLVTTTSNTVTGRSVTTDYYNLTTTAYHMNLALTIGLAAGIGGGGLILLIVVIVVLVVIFKRRKGRNNSGSDSRAEVESSGEDNDNDKIQNDVYAAVVPGKNQGNKTESSSETIYTSPLFTEEPNSTPPNSNYEEANRVKETYTVSPFRGQIRSIFPQGFNDLYANAQEVPQTTD